MTIRAVKAAATLETEIELVFKPPIIFSVDLNGSVPTLSVRSVSNQGLIKIKFNQNMMFDEAFIKTVNENPSAGAKPFDIKY